MKMIKKVKGFTDHEEYFVQDCLVAWPWAPWCVFIEDECRHQVLLEEVTIVYGDSDADGDGDGDSDGGGDTDGDGDGDNEILYNFTFSLQTRK